MTAEPPGDVLVGVCTHRRNDGLRRLLEEVAVIAGSRYAGWPIGVIVADDNPDGSAKIVTDELESRFPLGIDYRFVGGGNIAAARNVLLEAAVERADWLALLDDDEVPSPSWLAELARVQRITDADLVVGVVRPQWPPGTPRWLVESDLQHAPEYPDLSEPALGITGNALVRTSWLARTGHRFDAAYGRSGAEDTQFFATARRLRATIRYAASSVVHEDVLRARARLGYQLRRELRTGQQVARLGKQLDGWSNARVALRAASTMLDGVGRTISGALRRGRSGAVDGAGRVVRGAGIALGIAGGPPSHF